MFWGTRERRQHGEGRRRGRGTEGRRCTSVFMDIYDLRGGGATPPPSSTSFVGSAAHVSIPFRSFKKSKKIANSKTTKGSVKCDCVRCNGALSDHLVFPRHVTHSSPPLDSASSGRCKQWPAGLCRLTLTYVPGCGGKAFILCCNAASVVCLKSMFRRGCYATGVNDVAAAVTVVVSDIAERWTQVPEQTAS